MAKKIKAQVKLVIPGTKATPAPPVGTALGPHGINMQQFCTQFNDATKNNPGETTPVVVTVYEDRSFSFVLKTPPASALIIKMAGIQKGSGKPNTEKVGKLTKSQVKEIAQKKMVDMNAGSLEAAMKSIAGTARQMGVTIE
ncbi:MAG: 50S ribosomal protein L11 [bacterium]